MHGGSVKIVGEKRLQLPVEKLQRRVDALPEIEGQSADEDGDQQRAEKDIPEGMIVIPDIDLVRKDEGDFPALRHFLGEAPVIGVFSFFQESRKCGRSRRKIGVKELFGSAGDGEKSLFPGGDLQKAGQGVEAGLDGEGDVFSIGKGFRTV